MHERTRGEQWTTELAQTVRAWHESGFTPAVSGAALPAPSATPLSKAVFVVYGRDIPARDGFELLLRRMGLEPIINPPPPITSEATIAAFRSVT